MLGAYPGFHGNIEVFLSIQPTAVKGVIVASIVNHAIRAAKPAPELVPAAQDTTEREAKVKDWMDVIRPNLVLHTRIVKIVAHFRDGHLNDCVISEDER